MTTLAIFDLDNTLLNGDSDHAWGQFLIEQGVVDATQYREANDHFYQMYKEGNLNIYQFLAFALQPLAHHDRATLDNWHRQFMQQKVQPMLQQKAAALLAEHRSRGHHLMIITATNRFVTGPIATLLGVDTLLATDPETDENGEFTGNVHGTPCFREGKVERLQQWLADTGHSLAGSWFYSDSHNDLPLLQQVDNPVAVDADPQLAEHARRQGWPHISLRS
ncbi:MAG TPA: HAD family hydrolase [Pseudomonadales bacterium]